MSVKVSIINRSHHALPSYSTPLSAGMDIRANLNEPITLQPGERRLIPTGLFIALPEGYEAQIRPRSGLALKHGITVLNSPGTIDADYRGELVVWLLNTSDRPLAVMRGDRVAQLVFQPVRRLEPKAVTALSETERGSGGFGHTGRS